MLSNFRLGLQAADSQAGTGSAAMGTNAGEARYTSWARDPSVWSEWAGDSDMFDPDAVRVHLELEDVELGDVDVRFELQAADGGGSSGLGGKQFTPWASEGGGWCPVVTDSDAFDPDVFRAKIQTRPWTSTRSLPSDMRLGLQLVDNGGAQLSPSVVFTPWMSEGGGWSEWGVDADKFDPDGVMVKLEVRFP